MARTLPQISQSIKASFVANDILAKQYSLDKSKTFDEQFSSVSPEAAIIYIISMAHYVVERIIDTFKAEVEQRISDAFICSIPWYYAKTLAYQHGHNVIFIADKYKFDYETVDISARIIQYAAIRQVEDTITKLKIYTNKANHETLTTDELNAFKAYIKYISPAGIHFEFINALPDKLKFTIQIIFDPLVLKSTGEKIIGGSYPVRDAITAYINGITFGGTFNRTKLVDAIQAVEGVVDVILVSIDHATNTGEFNTVSGQNIDSTSGAFIINQISDTYTPNV